MMAKQEARPIIDAAGVAAAISLAERARSVEDVARELRMGPAILERLRAGDRVFVSRAAQADPTFVGRLVAWLNVTLPSLFKEVGRAVPPFDHLQDFWSNYYGGPRDGVLGLADGLARRPTRLLDFELSFPFGVPACALTPNSTYVEYFAARGFDLVTYKTVRDRPWNPHPYPQWAFAVDVKSDFDPTRSEDPVLAVSDYWPLQVERASLVNSFGVPSLPVTDWQRDLKEAKESMRSGQVLIASVMGSPETAASEAELVDQFVHTATLAVEAGAEVVEVNLSCPNTGEGGLICEDARASREVVAAVEKELRGRGTPLFMKTSYLPGEQLDDLVRESAQFINGIVAINSMSVPVQRLDGTPFFSGPNRSRAGLSGAAIKPWGLAVTRRLVELRDRYTYDYVIIGMGGVMTPDDFNDYMAAGADVVQSCSGAWLNPQLASEIRGYSSGSERTILDAATAIQALEGELRGALVEDEAIPSFLRRRMQETTSDSAAEPRQERPKSH